MTLLIAINIILVVVMSINADPKALLSGVTSLSKASGKTNLLSTHAGEQAVGLASATATSGSNLSTGANGELQATSFTESASNTNALLSGGPAGFGNLLDVGNITNNSVLASSVGGIASATATANTLVHASSDLANVENLANSSGFADTLINSTGGITNIDSIAGATAIATSILHSDDTSRANYISSVDSTSSSISDSLESIRTSLSDIGSFVQTDERSYKSLTEDVTKVFEIFNSQPVIVYNDVVDFEDFESSLNSLYETSLEYLRKIDNSNEIILTLKSVHVALLEFVFSVSNVTVTDLQLSSETIVIHETWNTGVERITVAIDLFVVALNGFLGSYDNLDEHTAISIHNVYLLTLSASSDVLSEFNDFLAVAINVSNGQTINLTDAVDLYLQNIVKYINYLNKSESSFINDSSTSISDIFNTFGNVSNQYFDTISTATTILNTYSETASVFTSSMSQFTESFDSINSVVSTFSGIIPLPDSFNSLASVYSGVSTNLNSVASQFSEISSVLQDNAELLQNVASHSDTIASTYVSIFESYDITNYVTVVDNADSISALSKNIVDSINELNGLASQGYGAANQFANNFQSITNISTAVTDTTSQISSALGNASSIDSLSNLSSIFNQVSDIDTTTLNAVNTVQNMSINASQFTDLLNKAGDNLASTESSLSFIADSLESTQTSLSVEEIVANISNAASRLTVVAENQTASHLSNHITFVSLASTTTSLVTEFEVLLQEYA